MASLSEVFKDMTAWQRQKLLNSMINDGAALSTAYAWCNGTRRPKYLYRLRIRTSVNRIMKHTGHTYTLEELFPDEPGEASGASVNETAAANV